MFAIATAALIQEALAKALPGNTFRAHSRGLDGRPFHSGTLSLPGQGPIWVCNHRHDIAEFATQCAERAKAGDRESLATW